VTLAEARALFPVLERIAYLNAGTFGPLPRPAAEALIAATERDLERGRSGAPNFEEVMGFRRDLRAAFGALVGTDPEQVALTVSTTEGCAIVLRGLGLGADDEVITTTDEHFGLIGPLGASGARVVVVDPDPERIVAAVGPRTRLIATSQVLWTNGAVLPLAEIRAQTGIPVLADGAQSVGAIPTTADGVDFLTISGQKWLCGPDSTGALVVRDPERLRVVSPSSFGQRRHEPDGGYDAYEGARRFDSGWWSSGLLQAMLVVLDVRPPWWHERATAAAVRCRELLAERFDVVTPEVASTLVAFRPEEDPVAVVARLHDKDVYVREIPGRGIVRVSCGWWTSDEDLDRLLAAL
jgi:selenocysteine lyase/cysteine desulfurase